MFYQPRVSVVVPVFNASATLGECIESVLRLRYAAERRELIFVDNASTDSTGTILAAYSSQIRIVHESCRGASASRNRGVSEAGGEIIAFTDADCIVDENWLGEIVSPLRDPAVGIAGGRILARQPCNAIEKFGESLRDNERAIQVYDPPYVDTANWASRRSVLLKVGLFDTDLLRSQDCDLSFRIHQAGYRLVPVPEAIVFHRNARTLPDLFREGFDHGYHAVRRNRKHAAYLRQRGYRRLDTRSYLSLLRAMRCVAFGPDSRRATCETVFNAAKKLGKLVGSARFGFLDL